MKSVDRTLENFGSAYIDLYYAHRFDHYTPLKEVIKTMNILIEQGKIRHWGTSNWSPAELERTFSLCDKYGWEGPIVDQTRYNLFGRYAGEFALQYVMDEHGLGLVPYKLLLEGIFAGRFGGNTWQDLSDASRKEISEIMRGMEFNEAVYNKLLRYDEIARELDLTPAQLTYAWTLQIDNVSSTLMSTRKPERIEENLVALDVNLSQDTINEINSLFPPEFNGFTTYNVIKGRGGPNLTGKLTEEMLKF
jgi:aryl-alcohol dehydrogenase-like predicted oxidoreductase